MIPYEDLCAALDGHAGRTPNRSSTPIDDAATLHGSMPPDMDPPTSEVDLPMAPQPGYSTHEGQMSDLAPAPSAAEDASNELDIGDVLSDEEEPT